MGRKAPVTSPPALAPTSTTMTAINGTAIRLRRESDARFSPERKIIPTATSTESPCRPVSPASSSSAAAIIAAYTAKEHTVTPASAAKPKRPSPACPLVPSDIKAKTHAAINSAVTTRLSIPSLPKKRLTSCPVANPAPTTDPTNSAAVQTDLFTLFIMMNM